MKKIFFLSLMAFTLTANAQGQQAYKPIDPMAFNPGIFSPVPMGTTQYAVAYIKEAPALSSIYPLKMVAYVQMLTATGQLVEVPLSGRLMNTPGDWNGYFIANRDTGKPVTYPKIVPMVIQVTGAITTDGRQLLDQNNEPIPETKIFF